jgi:VanZ family protein
VTSPTARRYFALLALGSATFTLVGSLVPFRFQSLSWAEASGGFVRAMTAQLEIDSKSDVIVNVMLGVPLGFALLGLLCADRQVSRNHAVLLGLAMLPGCAAFSAAVEFAQLYVPSRTCSGMDVLSQTVGAALGMTAWLGCGQWFTEQVRKATTGQGSALRFLVAYVLLLGFIQALPLDFSPSPYAAYHKFRDGGVKPIPFGEFRELDGDAVLGRFSTLLKLAGLYLPVGLIAARLPGRFWELARFKRVLLAGLGLALIIEFGQVLVQSRTTSATEAIIGGIAAFLGWLLGRTFRDGLNFTHLFFLGALWWAAMVWVSWQPFAIGAHVAFDWIPGLPLEGGNPLFALEEMLTKLVLFGLGGAILASADFGPHRRRGLAVIGALGLFASAFFEIGQTQFAGHTPCITDVMLGGLGAFCGAWVAGKV